MQRRALWQQADCEFVAGPIKSAAHMITRLHAHICNIRDGFIFLPLTAPVSEMR
jgi:hypothetical protein